MNGAFSLFPTTHPNTRHKVFISISAEDKEAATLSTGDEYYVSFTISSTVSGSITVNGNEVEISAGETEVNVKSTTTLEQDASYWADYGYTDETTGEEAGEWIETTAATLRVQLGVAEGDFLGAATIEISELEFAPYVPAEGTESITASGLSNVNGVDGESDGLMHYWANSAKVTEAVHDLTEDTYTIEYSDASGDWWGFQIFWMLTAEQLESYELEEGGMYTLEFDLYSSIAGSIKVINEEVNLSVGENHISVVGTVNSTSSDNATFHIWMGTATTNLISAASIVISNITFVTYVMPSEYDNTYKVDFSATTLSTQDYGDEVYDSNNPGYLCRWADQTSWGAPADVTVSNESLTADGYKATFTASESSYWYDFQLFYETPTDTIPSGVSFFVEMDITVDKAVSVTINDNVVSLSAGLNEGVTVLSGHTKGAQETNWDGTVYSKTDLEFQAGVSGTGIAATELTLFISALSFHWNNAA